MPSIRKKLSQKKTNLAIPRQSTKDHPANLDYYEDGSFFNVEMDLINPDPAQPRKFFDSDSLAELSQSIKKRGVLQPVVIRRDQEGKIYLVAGERRYRAAKMAGLGKIPCILSKGDPGEIALIENLQREDFNPIEEAEALARLMQNHNYTQEQLTNIVTKAQSTISETLSLNKLPEELKKQVRNTNVYPRRLLVEVVKQKTPEKMFALFEQIKGNNLTSSQVRQIRKKGSQKPKTRPIEAAHKKIKSLNKDLDKLIAIAGNVDKKERAKLLLEFEDFKTAVEAALEKMTRP